MDKISQWILVSAVSTLISIVPIMLIWNNVLVKVVDGVSELNLIQAFFLVLMVRLAIIEFDY